MTDTELARVEAALDGLLASHDPKMVDDRTFRGARDDAGLAWVHFPEGFGGLGVRPELNRVVEERVCKAGAAAQDPSTCFIALAGPTIMRNILGEQVLGLPGEPRVDKDQPWSKVPRS